MVRLNWAIGACVVVALWGCDAPAESGDGGTQPDGGARPDSGPIVCTSDAFCGDELFCNGVETCQPGAAGADADGCVAGASACEGACDEATDRCTDDCDADGDGHDSLACAGDDCDDTDADRYPDNPEVCDALGHDEDCDPGTFGVDGDGDGAVRLDCCQEQLDGSLACGGDCNDASADISPTAPESCNGVDDNCDGRTDEGVLTTFYVDADHDGFGDPAGASIDACASPTDFVANRNDCDDTSASVSPVGVEECNEVDDDCDGTADDGVCSLCPPGYSGVDGECLEIDECAEADRCGRTLGGGAVNGCANTPGSYTCTCGAGFEAIGAGLTASCADVSECARGTDDCDRDPAASCTNTSGAFECACPPSFAGTGHGAGGCLWDDPSLLSLVARGGALSPAFAPGTTAYTLTLGSATGHATLAATTAQPGRTTLTIDGAPASSGVASLLALDVVPRPIAVIVTTESGATRTYTVMVQRLPIRYVKASNTGSNDWLGTSVALSADGSTLAVGAPHESSAATGVGGDQTSNGAGGSGAVYVFRRSGATWAQEAYVKASNTESNDQFGTAVALSADGSVLAVVANGEDSDATGVDGDQTNNDGGSSGAVYVFRRTGSTWSQEAYVKGSNTSTGDSISSVALSGDGSTLAVGAPQEDSAATGIDGDQSSDGRGGSGAVYVFRRAGTTWIQEAYVKASNTGSGDRFGASVALSGDGSTLAVGALDEDSAAVGVGGDQTSNAATDSGAVYVFRRSGVTWTQEAYVKASNTGSGDGFGGAIALSADGAALAVGAWGEDSAAIGVGGDQLSNAAADSGAVYVFRRSGSTWVQEVYLKASNTQSGDQFGWSVALSADGSALAVGARREGSAAVGLGGDQTSSGALSSGAVYVFRRSGSTWMQEAYVKASNTDAGDELGISVAMNADGFTLAVGARNEDSAATGVGGDQSSNAAANSGAVYVY